MARPKTKEDLIQQGVSKYKLLVDMIDSVPHDQLESAFTFDVSEEKQAHWRRDKNIRDVIIHLVEWHCLLINWVESNNAGEKRPFFPEGYNWRTYGELNMLFWQKHQTTTLQKSLKELANSHEKVIKLIETFSNEQLFTKRYFDWTGSTSLGSYFVSSTSSHYDWAMKKIKRHLKTIDEQE